ncbi:RagB/SusD family nutrient uptake outer membrane protein [Limibacter armeniacum]|uniref:RagB/SusD family nutrient uptake outer membrane protein n=1 Tax=Limibacter armeniacum TaxID=466084 RepID=UPI002FE535C9
MTHKGIKGIFWAICLLVGWSCSDDFLDKRIQGSISNENFLQSEGDAIRATIAIYNELYEIYDSDWLIGDIASDLADKGSSSGDDGGGFIEVDNFPIGVNNGRPRQWWEGNYRGINRANQVINRVPDIEMDEATQSMLLGEAKFLRGLFYFNLATTFGGVPIYTELPDKDLPIRPRASLEEVYDVIIGDLREAETLLPPVGGEGYEQPRASRGAAQAMLAKTYLYMQNYDSAAFYAEEVINSGNYALIDDYKEVWRQESELGSESVFSVAQAANPGENTSGNWTLFQGVRGRFNKGFGFNSPSEVLQDDYESGDPRLDATVLYIAETVLDRKQEISPEDAAAGDFETIPPAEFGLFTFNQKAYVETKDRVQLNDFSPKNIRLIRYADVLLIAAEALNETGNSGDALVYLNQVRERARNSSPLSVDLGVALQNLNDSIRNALGTDESLNGVVVRRVYSGSNAETAGLNSFVMNYFDVGMGRQLYAESIDIIMSVNGQSVSDVEDVYNLIDSAMVGSTVTFTGTRYMQDANRNNTTTGVSASVTVNELLPDIEGLSGTELRDAIWQERVVEFAMEGHSFWDAVRMDNVEAGTLEQRIVNEHGKTNFNPQRDRLLPIPQTEIDRTGGVLEQNPNY